MIRFRLLALAVPLAAAALAGSALAYVCHPAAPGTRMLTLTGTVRSVAVQGKLVRFVVAGRHGCSRISWSTATGRALLAPAACAVRSPQVGGLQVGVDRRGRPVLHAGGRTLPLPAFARSAVASHGIALVEATRPDGG